MAEEKVFTPQVIEDQPLPGQEVVLTDPKGSTGEIVTPKTIKDQSLPHKVIAHETIGSALNTKSRKILGAFEFTETGSLQVGKYENGVSGDLRLTPAGITARNISGNTTFNIDGDNGDAVFAGTLQAGTLIGGDGQVVIQEEDGHGQIWFIEGGKVAISLGWGDF